MASDSFSKIFEFCRASTSSNSQLQTIILHARLRACRVAPFLRVRVSRFVSAVARDTGAAVLVLFAGRGVIGCPDGLTAVTCELALRIIIIIWGDALAHAVTTHAVGGAERLCVINVTGRATRRSAFEPDSLKGLHRGALER